MMIDIVPIWTIILGVAVFMYVLLDGFDLGVGILFPFAPNDKARDLMMKSVAPIWDGNETWLVLGIVALFAAFPLAFAIIIPAAVFSDARDAARPDVSRGRVRISADREDEHGVLGSSRFSGDR